MALSKYKVKWSDRWLEIIDGNEDRIGSWCSSEGDGKALCSWCKWTISVQSGKTNLISHSQSSSHVSNSKSQKSTSKITLTFGKQSQGSSSSLDLAKIAEIRVATRMVIHNYSFESNNDLVGDLKAILPDSKIVDRMTLGADKLTYLVREALFPYLKQEVLNDIKNSEFYSVQIDEANKLKSYLGIVIRYVDPV